MKWLSIDQDNLEMKFLALNSDFSNLSLDYLGLKISALISIKEMYPWKWLFYRD